MTRPSAILTVLFVALLSTNALAVTSYMTLDLRFYQHQGHYCPATRTCTGAKYLQSQYNTNQPLQKMKVYLYRNGVLIGQGSTGTDGRAAVSFTWPGPNQFAQVVIRFEEANGRWVLRTTANAVIQRSSTILLPYAPKPELPANVTITYGTSASPDQHANVFDGANKTWLNALSQSAVMQSVFTGIVVKTFTDPGGTDCPTSCALGKVIKLDSNAPYAPSMRIMHEMGHVADFLSHDGNDYAQRGCYLYPTTCDRPGSTPGVWNLTDPEWSSAAFEEGLATFHATAALYGPNSGTPHVCLDSAVSCPASFYNVESVPTCPGDGRDPLTVTRYFWDTFDQIADTPVYWPAGETATPLEFATILDTLAQFPAGTTNGAEDETTGIDADGRSLVDYRKYSSVPETYYTTHCSPPGD